MDKQRVPSVIVGYTREKKKRNVIWHDVIISSFFPDEIIAREREREKKEVINYKVYIYT